jgi:hypothetical protein
MINKKILNVSYKDKDKAKQLGAKWDPQQKVWYAPAGKDLTIFAAWLVKPSTQPDLVISSIGLVRNIISCWSCKGYCTVCAIYARKLTENRVSEDKAKVKLKVKPEIKKDNEITYVTKTGFFIILEISEVPDSLAEFLSLRCHNFRPGKLNDTGEKFYRNHCDHCAIGLSDQRLHKKGQCFNPVKINDCKNMQFIDLLFFDDLKIKANYLDYSNHDLLLNTVTTADYLTDYI